MVRRGSTVRVRQRALQRASKWPFLLPEQRTPVARSSLNLSPRSVPNISGAFESWLEQRRLTSSSTSCEGRGSIVPSSGTASLIGSRRPPGALGCALAPASVLGDFADGDEAL